MRTPLFMRYHSTTLKQKSSIFCFFKTFPQFRQSIPGKCVQLLCKGKKIVSCNLLPS